MIGTLISLIVAGILWFFESHYTLNVTVMQISAVSLALLALVLRAITSIQAFGPLQRVEQNLTPRILDLYRGDRLIKLTWGWVCLFTFAILILAILDFKIGDIGPRIWFLVLVVGLGVTFDLYRLVVYRILGYFNPFVVIHLLKQQAKEAIQDEREADLCNWIDSLAEVCMKSLNRSSTALCQNAINELQEIAKIFLSSSKNLGHHETDAQLQALGVHDKLSFILFYIFQRLEMIHARSVELKLEPVASNTITALGKIAIYAAKLDITLLTYPLLYIGKFAVLSIKRGMPDVGVKASCTLLEVARTVINEVDLKFAELQDPFFALIRQQEEIMKELFRQDKKINFKILNQPFLDLKELFQNEKVVNHQDKPIIIRDIDRVLDEFINLEAVMKTIPPLNLTE